MALVGRMRKIKITATIAKIREIDRLRVLGRATPVAVFEVLDSQGLLPVSRTGDPVSLVLHHLGEIGADGRVVVEA